MLKSLVVESWIGGFRRFALSLALAGACFVSSSSSQASPNVYLTEAPDYEWHAGCFGTASGNLMGYWDRHGFPSFYTGPTGYGVAPLNSFGVNYGIRSLWASQAGLDGRPADKPGHLDDYYVSYASTAPDPYVTLGRAEHDPDCLGDFMGLNQRKWTNLNGECDGNIDAYSFVYWDSSGDRRVNFTPGAEAGLPAIDIQSGLRAWTQFRGYTAEVFTQLSDFNPAVLPGKGFTFEDLKAEINAGYPVLFFLQSPDATSRALPGMDRANPLIHGILAYGYLVANDGTEHVRYRTSFAGGDGIFSAWRKNTLWSGIAPLRGVIAYHPRPQITSVTESNGQLTIQWHGPNSLLHDLETDTTKKLHWYVVERTTSLTELDFAPITPPTNDQRVTLPITDLQNAYFRLQLLPPPAHEDNLPN